jgi:ParB family chromosome partitioning protein
MSDNNRLGRGLGAIFGENVTSVLEDIQKGTEGSFPKEEIELSKIHPNPYQPRIVFDPEKISELAQSIQEHGVFTPILVRRAITGYQLIAGERRVRASKQANLKSIPAIIMDFSEEEMMEISLIENIQRENLNTIEEANAYSLLIERMGLTQEQVAKKVGKSREHITNILRLRKLPQSVQDLVRENKLTMGHVRPLITLGDDQEIETLAKRILKENLSVRAVEQLVRLYSQPKKEEIEKDKKDYRYVIELIQKKVQSKVKVDEGKIIISFSDDDELNRILETLGCLEEEN